MNFFSDERAAELRDLFFESAQELLQALNEQGLELEKRTADAELVRGIRRTVHTLKGDSAACGFQDLSNLAHELEDVLKPELAAASGDALAQVVLSAADMFDAYLAAHRGKLEPPQPAPLRSMIARLLKSAGEPKPVQHPIQLAPWTEYDRLLVQRALDSGEPVCRVVVAIVPECPMPVAAAQMAFSKLEEFGTVLARRPEDVQAEPSTTHLEALVSTRASARDIESACAIPTIVQSVAVCPWEDESRPKPHAPEPDVLGLSDARPQVAAGPVTELEEAITEVEMRAPLLQAPRTEPSAVENTVRVDADRIDAVMDLVGELIIGKSMLYQTIHEFGKLYPKDPLRNRFTDAMAKQSQVLNALQRSVMKIRMVPVEQLFRRFPRVIRDTAKICGKDAELVMVGQDTDLDKGILDQLAEPLTHLLRNAVDHGIESAEERIASGKSPQGFVKLTAYHQANHVVIEVGDDGRGIDAEKVAAKAVQSGMTSAEQVARMTDQQKLEFIFESGFSTNDHVTSISGRGVGMDVVHNVIARLKGSIQIISKPGQGATFRLTLPLTLAIIKALLFSSGDQCYAVPLKSVVEITRASLDQVHRADGCEMLHVRDEVIALARLSRLMPQAVERSSNKFFVVIVRLGDQKFGLVVDKLVGEDELVIKAIDDQLVATDLVSGASILGDGTVVLILNVPVLVERAAYERAPIGAMTTSRSARIGAAS
mgnify:CR=1 FL=1